MIMLARRSLVTRFVTRRRTHVTHESPPEPPSEPSGPRQYGMELGLPAAQSTSNVVRLLESTSQAAAGDVGSTLWHKDGLCWKRGDQGWKATPIAKVVESKPKERRLISLEFADSRTALAQLIDEESTHFISLLKLDSPKDQPFTPHDGWTIVRQVTSSNDNWELTRYSTLEDTLEAYQAIEHDGGAASSEALREIKLYHHQATIMAVGMMDESAKPSKWQAPVGQLLEIPLARYLHGISTQTPHDDATFKFDRILRLVVQFDMAFATIRMGSGLHDLTYCDHLLLGCNVDDEWQILTKIYSPQPWSDTGLEETY